MVNAQEGRCAICKKSKKLQVDHSHVTGHVRAMLCGTCNRALGLLKDDAAIVGSTLEYLRRFGAV
jgi:hypothetical protein